MKFIDNIHYLDNHLCPWWFAYMFDNPLRRLLHRPEEVLGPYLKEGMTALDIGCGIGHFSIGMARIVGVGGRVIAADLQQKMLDRVRGRAERAGLADRISYRLCSLDSIGVTDEVDFVLTFWMAHEVHDTKMLFEQVRSVLKDGGRWLFAEPKLHTSRQRYESMLETAKAVGFSVIEEPAVAMSYAAALKKTD